MMQHDDCIQFGCMASFVQNQLGLEPPRFPIGASVRSAWIDETGRQRIDHGLVVGIFPAPAGWLGGWWYVVRLPSIEGCWWLDLPYDDQIHEADLELWPTTDQRAISSGD